MSSPARSGRGGEWIYLSRELLGDLLDVMDAEVAAARSDLGISGRFAGKAAVFFAIAASILIWLPAILGYVMVRVLAQWLPDWGAGLIVFAFFLVVAGILGLIGWSKMKRIENPIDTVTRRTREHLGWWRSEVSMRGRPHDGAHGGPVGVADEARSDG